MAFRADESAERNYEEAERYLVPPSMYANDVERRYAKETLWDLTHELGPVVDAYPTWHPRSATTAIVSQSQGRAVNAATKG